MKELNILMIIWNSEMSRTVRKTICITLFLSFRRVVNLIYSFLGNSPAYEDGTDSEFRNVGN